MRQLLIIIFYYQVTDYQLVVYEIEKQYQKVEIEETLSEGYDERSDKEKLDDALKKIKDLRAVYCDPYCYY